VLAEEAITVLLAVEQPASGWEKLYY